MFFFDSHGFMWATCAPEHPSAEAFGPKWAARPASLTEIGLTPEEGVTAWTTATAAGLVVEGEEWSTVADRVPA